jgi:dipeptidyl aminopeptidase/acylaminoacyl peptidase
MNLGTLLILSALAQPPAVIRPGENLVLENVPPLRASMVAEVRRYMESRSARMLDWHPQRREMLIATRFANTPQIHRVAMPRGARTQLTFESEPIQVATMDPREGRFFVFEKDTGGNEFMQLYRYDFDSGRSTLLTDGGRSQNSGVEWSRRGDRIAFGSTRRNGADRDIYVLDPRQGKLGPPALEVQGGGWSVMQWSPDDRALLVGEYLSIQASRLWLVDLANGQKKLVTPEGDKNVAYPKAQFRADGRALYLITDRGSEFLHLASLELASGKITPVAADLNWDVEDFELSPDGKWIAMVSNEAGISRLHLLDTASGVRRPASAVPEGILMGLRWHPNSREVGFTLSDARSSGDAYSLDPASGKLTRWTASELGGLVASELSRPTLIRYKSFDNREITGFLYAPPARFTGRRPTIVWIHGGPEAQSRPQFIGQYNYFLNQLGMAIVMPNVRGSAGFGKTFVSLDNGLRREDSVRDIGALLDWIAAQPGLDPARVVVMGGSYGGFMTLATATQYSDRIAAAIDIVGISNFNTFLKNTESYRRDLRRAEYGDERDPQIHAFFERIAPLSQAHRITKPLFVVQGGNDPRVPASEAEQMVAKLKQRGTPVWYLLAKDEGHGFRKKHNADFLFYATVEFIRRYGR